MTQNQLHFLTMAADDIEWTTNKRKAWQLERRRLVQVEHLCLNVNDDYSYKMNSVDVADQLRKQDELLVEAKKVLVVRLFVGTRCPTNQCPRCLLQSARIRKCSQTQVTNTL